MDEFNQTQKVFVKSNNSIQKIHLNYTYSLIFILVSTLILYLIFDYQENAINLIKNFLLITIIASAFKYIINIIKKDYSLKSIYRDYNLLSISIIISLFSQNNPYYIIIIAIFLTIVIKNINNKRNLSSTLYGILILIIYNSFFTNHLYINVNNIKLIDYLINPSYISPILSIISFIYIFYKKSIKYNIVIAYFLTYFSIIFLYTVLNSINPYNILIALMINSPIFLSIYTLSDYKITPTISESGIIYGIISGLISAILYFIIPDLSIIISMIVSPLILTNYLDKISPKLKYNPKTYYLYITISFIMVIIAIIILSLVF